MHSEVPKEKRNSILFFYWH